MQSHAKIQKTPEKMQVGYKMWDSILKCDIFGFPQPKITWTRSLEPLPVERHVKSGNKLIIKGTAPQDGGPYVCRGRNHLGTVFAVIWLAVKDVGKLNFTIQQTRNN